MFQKVDPKTLTENVFSLLGDRWTLITAGTAEDCNTMTASWGGLGVLWGEPVVTIYVRPQRHTRAFLEKSPYFTLSFFREGEYRKELALCGAKSGSELNKFEACGFTVETDGHGAPYVGQADLVLVCEKQYADTIKPACFLDRAAEEKWYPEKDHHTMYIGRVVTCLKRTGA